MNRRSLLGALAAPALIGRAVAQGRDGVPPGTITLIVPFAAGGPTDVVSRLVGEAMGRDLGQTVVVENVTGAGGTIGAARVAAARNDGTTMLMHHIGHATAATLYRTLRYDVQESFAPIGLVTEVPMIITARLGLPGTTLPELLALIRREGDKLNLGHSGIGGSDHLCGILLMRAAGRAVTTVAFRGGAPALSEMLAGRIDLHCAQATSAAAHLREGQIKAYAVTTEQHLPPPVIDRIPTVFEAGQPDMQVSVWHGLYLPKGAPDATVRRMSRALQAALRSPHVISRFAELVTAPVAQDRATPEYHRQFLATEVARWRPLIQEAGIYAD
ncbi:MAG TPA: tripartite tricarboxylate transporter substrate-binding protein [Roseomonas sp.]|jgi:tripartite-type tricarboxylate transporter receptor subunit TctC